MVSRAPRPCRSPGCSGLCRDGSGYCESHRSERSNWSRYHAGKSATARGYGALWKRQRRVAITRDKGLCQACLKDGRLVRGSEVDHIVPKSQGGTDSLANLQLLCTACHAAKTGRESN